MRGLGYMVTHPAFGVGMRNFQVAEGTISPRAKLQERGIGVWWGAAHNTYVQAGAELGIPGLLLLLGLLGTSFLSLRRLARDALRVNPAGSDLSRLAQCLMAALIGFAVGAFFLSLAYADMLYALVAFSIALTKIARSDYSGARDSQRLETSLPRYAGYGSPARRRSASMGPAGDAAR
jgi:O-antigen ligase